MPNAMDVALYFLSVAPENDITHLKLQKLCAYAQAISLGYTERPFFDEEIEAWTHGPVIPSLYQEFKTYGNAVIPAPVEVETALRPFSQEQRYILQMTWATYGRFTAWALREQSHWDFPGDFESRGAIIPKNTIMEVFRNSPLVRRMHANDSISDAAHALDI